MSFSTNPGKGARAPRDAKARALLAGLPSVPPDLTAADLLVVAPEVPAGLPVRQREGYLALLGLHDLEAQIRAELRGRPGAIPVLVVVGAWARVQYVTPCGCGCAA